MIAKVSNAGVESPFNIDGGFTSFKYVEISLMVLINKKEKGELSM